MYLERSLHYRIEENVDQVKGWRCTLVLKVWKLYVLRKIEAGREFQFFEVMGTNVLANEVVRHFSNLTARECWESAKRMLRAKHALAEITDFNSSLPNFCSLANKFYMIFFCHKEKLMKLSSVLCKWTYTCISITNIYIYIN